MTKAMLRKLIEGHEAAAELERLEHLDNPRSPQESLDRLLPLVELTSDFHGWPLREDAVTERELVVARGAWDRLRLRLTRP